RYSTTVVAPSPELRTRASSRSMVVQVSGGEQADGAPRPLDRYADNRLPSAQAGVAAVDVTPPAPALAQQLAPPDAPATGMPGDREAVHRYAEKARAR